MNAASRVSSDPVAPVDRVMPAARRFSPGPASSPAREKGDESSSRVIGAFVWVGLGILALAIYLPYALKAGWYYDDWADYATFKRAGGSWGAQFDACTSSIPAGRKLTCLYHVTEYHLFGDRRALYHLLAIFFLVAMAGLTYAILKRCRLPWPWAALGAALLIVFPSSDSTRLWPTGAIGQYVIVIELVGVLLALAALERPRGASRVALHAGATVLFLIAMTSYEIAVPLVALNGIVYWAARRDRAALRRGAADFLLAVLFVGYRLVLEPADPASGFTVHRTLHGDAVRAWNLISDAWATWHETFLPGPLGTIGVIAILALAALLFAREREMRQRMKPWLWLLLGSLAIGLAATFVFLTANDLYYPQVSGTFNRVVLPASIAYVGVFVALVGLGFEIVRRFAPLRHAAVAAVTLVVLATGIHQFRISSDHKRAWESSWNEQQVALDGYAQAVRGLPPQSRVVGFGTPIWEGGFVPIFSASWDLGNAIDYTTSFEPSAASPLVPNMTCGRRGLTYDGILSMPYRTPGQPLYFIDSTRRTARLVSSQVECRQAIASLGRPPLFAPTLRG